MMMVMAVMAEALHLLPNYGQTPFGVKLFLLRFTQGFACASNTVRDSKVPKSQPILPPQPAREPDRIRADKADCANRID